MEGAQASLHRVVLLGHGGRAKGLFFLWIVVKSVALEFFVMPNQEKRWFFYYLFRFSDHFMPCSRL